MIILYKVSLSFLVARKLFAQNLRRVRLIKGYSQEYLAELAGLHRTYIGSVERAERNISIDNMEKIATALGVNLVELVTSNE